MAENSQTTFPVVIRKTPGVLGGDACEEIDLAIRDNEDD